MDSFSSVDDAKEVKKGLLVFYLSSVTDWRQAECRWEGTYGIFVVKQTSA